MLVLAASVLGGRPFEPRTVGPDPGFFTVFSGDTEPAVLWLPPNPGEALLEAAREFRARVGAMGGPTVPLWRGEGPPPPSVRAIRFAEGGFPASRLFPDGTDERFRLEVGPRRLVIRANDRIGWEFGLYALLDEYGGVRWFWPGEEGTVTPERSSWRIPYGSRSFEPAFVSRKFSGLRGADEKRWARRNRLKSVFSFGHNLRRTFDRDFFLAHPETLAVEWSADDPPPPGHRIWRSQPDLSSETVVEAAAEAALEAFRADPTRASYSLGTNDNTRFGESPGIRREVRPMRYFRDLPDYSDLVFGFMNRVAAIVAEEFPDRFLGCLSYMWAENVPSFPVHPMVLPYLTADRSQGYDVAFSAEDRALVEAWTAAGPILVGIYDYPHGAPHTYPRRANLLLGERIEEAAAAGVRAYHAEVNPIWGFHGDLPWALARQLWRPDLDPGRLEAEFLRRFFGPAAGPMGDFYRLARERWMGQDGSAVWVKFFVDEAGVELFPPGIREKMRAFLAEAARATDGGRFAERVAAVREAWRLTEAAARMQEARRKLFPAGRIDGAEPVLAFLRARREWRETIADLRARPWSRNAARCAFSQSDPVYHAVARLLADAAPDERFGLVNDLFLGARELGDEAALLTLRLAERADRLEPETVASADRLREATGPIRSTGPEPWEIQVEEPWEILLDASERVRVRFVEGDGSLRIEDAHAAGIARFFPVERGRFYEGRTTIAARVSPGNRTSVAFRWWGEHDRPLGNTRGVRVPTGAEETEETVTVFGYPPSGAVRGALVVSAARQERGDRLTVRSLRIDSYPLAGSALSRP